MNLSVDGRPDGISFVLSYDKSLHVLLLKNRLVSGTCLQHCTLQITTVSIDLQCFGLTVDENWRKHIIFRDFAEIFGGVVENVFLLSSGTKAEESCMVI